MEFECSDFYLKGLLSSYFELLDKEIRKICLPNVGFHNKKETEFIKKEAEKRGFKTLLVRYKREKGIISYQRIIYIPSERKIAYKLRTLLEKQNKTKNEHIKIGEILGYSKRKIREFIS